MKTFNQTSVIIIIYNKNLFVLESSASDSNKLLKLCSYNEIISIYSRSYSLVELHVSA